MALKADLQPGFRYGWYHHGFTVDQLPYKAAFGIWGSYAGVTLKSLALIATFYTSLFPVGGSPDAEVFFENYLAAPLILGLYLFWKLYSRHWPMWVKIQDMDVTTGVRRGSLEMAAEMRVPAWKNALRAFF